MFAPVTLTNCFQFTRDFCEKHTERPCLLRFQFSSPVPFARACTGISKTSAFYSSRNAAEADAVTLCGGARVAVGSTHSVKAEDDETPRARTPRARHSEHNDRLRRAIVSVPCDRIRAVRS